MNYQKFSLAFGFSVWLAATLIFRFWGHTFFLIENHLLITGFFAGTVPVLYSLVRWVFNKYKLTGNTRLRSTVLMTVPGMLGDVGCLNFHYLVFPKLTTEQAVVLGAWIIWAYVIVLLIGMTGKTSIR